ASPARDGVSRTNRNDSSQNTARIAAGTRNIQARPWLASGVGTGSLALSECATQLGQATDAIILPQSNTKYRPSEIRMPKIPPNVPRARRGTHDTLPFTIATAPKLWKYMLSVNRTASAVTESLSIAPVSHSAPISAWAAGARAAETRIAARPPSRSASGP